MLQRRVLALDGRQSFPDDAVGTRALCLPLDFERFLASIPR
jgi:hypothetical protein